MHFGIRKKIRRVLIWIWGTKLDERYWVKRYRKDQSDLIKDHYAKDRLYLLKKIKSSHFNSILEIGAKEGRNLRMIAKSFPDKRFVGIDISKEAIELGNKLFYKEGFSNVRLFEADAEQLKFENDSFDTVLVFAVLIYFPSNKIKKVIAELLRVAKKRILILEWHDPLLSKGKFLDHWIYNYNNLFQDFRDQINSIEITKIPEKEFDDKNWRKYGYFIDIRI